VKRELLIVVGAATIAAAGVAGCSHGNRTSGPASITKASATVDGEPQNVDGPVVCSTTDGRFSISFSGKAGGFSVDLAQDASVVHSVELGRINNVNLSYKEGMPGENATATKDGNYYKITGMAFGATVNWRQPHAKVVRRPFEIDVTCP
jgi:ipoprotein LpqH